MDKVESKNLAVNNVIKKVISDAILVEPKRKFNIIIEDPDDNKILECAVEGNADYIISYDSHILKLKEFQGIKKTSANHLFLGCSEKSLISLT